MGVSCDIEGSMETEINLTCNSELIKLSGDGPSDLNETPAKMVPAIDNTTNVNKSTDMVINLVSPTPQETEVVLIGDDAEPEEGEITASENDFEYEAISSEEESTLRQQIEAFEAQNRELEKIESISRTSYYRPPSYANVKASSILKRFNSSTLFPTLSSVSNYKALSHVENISSDEAQLVDSDPELNNIIDYGKLYSRSNRTSRKEKRQNRRKARTNDNERERCLVHGKRRCADIECNPIDISISRKKRARYKSEDRKVTRGVISNDSEEELLRNREELKMALNITAPSDRPVSSSLSHKLSAIQNNHTLQCSKTAIKRKKRKSSKSPDRSVSEKKRPRSNESDLNRLKNGHARITKTKVNLVQENAPLVNQEHKEDDDEAISLELQELRLIALKSAVLKKHEARKKKQQVTQQTEQVIRPYSPTDSVVLAPDDNCDRSNECIDSDNNNMDISPISSPGNQCQAMDMDLASSNENSKSPIFSYEKHPTFSPFDSYIDWGTVHIPVPMNATFVEFEQSAALAQPYTLQHPYTLYDEITEDSIAHSSATVSTELPIKENEHHDNEDELRAQLIKQMRNSNTSNGNVNSDENASTSIVVVEKVTTTENHVDSLEEDCLRSLLLSSKGKKSYTLKKECNAIETPNDVKCDDMPKLALNLREALKRLKKKSQSGKNDVVGNCQGEAGILPLTSHDSEIIESTENCDQPEIQKTVVNNQLDKNEIEHRNTNVVTPLPLETCAKTNIVPVNTNSVKSESLSAFKTNIVEKKTNLGIKKTQENNQKKTIDSKIVSLSKPIVKTVPIKAPKMPVLAQLPEESPNLIKPKFVAKVKTVNPTPKPRDISAVVSLKSSVISPSNLTRVESIRKSSSSPVTTWIAKPVKRLIISLNADSSSDNDDMEFNSIKTGDQIESKSSDHSNAFQKRLDQFLQTVRANTDATQDIKSVTPRKETPTASIANKTINVPNSSKIGSAKAVAHLPMSSQLEYRRLVERMQQLEKRKEKSRRKESTTDIKPLAEKSESNFSNLTVIVQNENRFIQTNNKSDVEINKIVLEDKKKLNKVLVNKAIAPTNMSLTKKVLVKNALDCLLTNATSESENIQNKEGDATVTSQTNGELSQGVESSDKTSDGQSFIQPEPITLEKKPDQTAVLDSYVKRYLKHGEQYLSDLTKLHRLTCRANIETRKQQKLEQELEELKQQVKLFEEKVSHQKMLTKRLRPLISTTEKTIIADRPLVQKLQSTCHKYGHIIYGQDYKIPCDKGTQIREKIRLINIEKGKLKLLHKNTITTSHTDPPKPIAKCESIPVTTKNVLIASPAVIMDNNTKQATQNDANTIKNDKPSTNESTEQNANNSQQAPTENMSIQLKDDRPIKSPLNDTIHNPTQKTNTANGNNHKLAANIEVDRQSSENLTGADSETLCGKYDSPLEHMCNDIQTEPCLSIADRNAIVCPFDLMGRCEDKQCEYKHLSV